MMAVATFKWNCIHDFPRLTLEGKSRVEIRADQAAPSLSPWPSLFLCESLSSLPVGLNTPFHENMEIISKDMVIKPMSCSHTRLTEKLGADVLSFVLRREVGCCRLCCFCLLIILSYRVRRKPYRNGARRDLGKPQNPYTWG